MSKLHKIEIEKILKNDVLEIFNAQNLSKPIHGTGDIRAAGNQVEIKVRDLIRKKLPLKYYVGNGHIVDENLNVSSQLDIIIADNSGSPVLLKAEDGTEYFPYESIYAFGEVKSTYNSAKKPIETFIENTKNIYEHLHRKQTNPNQISQDFSLIESDFISFQSTDKRPYKNPLFKFMFFVSSNDFKIEDFRELIAKTDSKYLPNVICFLDGVVIVNSKIERDSKSYKVNFFPEFSVSKSIFDGVWTYCTFLSEDFKDAANFAFLIFALNEHLKNCLVMRPFLSNYFSSMFKVDVRVIVPDDDN